MTEAETYSWIFYAASAATMNDGASLRDIEAVADGINHAVPTQKELSSSLSWVESKGLIEKVGKKIIMTDHGRGFMDRFATSPGSVMKIWDRIAHAFTEMGADNKIQLDCRTMKPKQ
jgi:hypothetical protein